MAKLFKTISLEERWKNSGFNLNLTESSKAQVVSDTQSKIRQSPTINFPRKNINQGGIDLKTVVEGREQMLPNIPTMPNIPDNGSVVLKSVIETKSAANIPVPTPFITQPLSNFATPFVNTKFTKTVSLADRLDQSKLGTTKHLAQFFLSDIYTNYIEISPFGLFEHSSNIQIQPFTFKPQQGGVVVQAPNYDSLILQGTTVSNGVYQSYTNVVVNTTFDSLVLQGTYFSNGIYQSFIIPQIPVGADDLLFIPNLVLNTPPGSDALLTDPEIVPTVPASIRVITTKQGIVYVNQNSFSVINVAYPTTTQTKAGEQGIVGSSSVTSVSNPTSPQTKAEEQGIIDNNSYISTGTPSTRSEKAEDQGIIGGNRSGISVRIPPTSIKQGETTVAPFTFKPVYNSPILKVLFYEAQRLAASQASTAPVIHGSTTVDQTFKSKTNFLGGDKVDIGAIKAYKSRDGRSTPYPMDESLIKYIGELKTESIDPQFPEYRTDLGTSITTTKNSIEYTNRPKADTDSDNTTKLMGSRDPDGDGTVRDELSNLVDNKLGKTTRPDAPSKRDKLEEGTTDLSRYKTLTYGQIKARAKDKTNKTIGTDYRTITQVGVDGTTGGKPTDWKAKTVDTTKRGDSDFIDLVVSSYSGDTIRFTALISTFSDSFTIGWNDINYVGRQDTLKAFKGVTRGGNIAFKLPAFSPNDMKTNYSKLNRLVKAVAVGNPLGGSDNYVVGPLCKLTVGKWFSNTPVVFSSVKFDVQMADYSWDIDLQAPHLVDVALDFAVIGDISGKPYDARNNDYFAYRG